MTDSAMFREWTRWLRKNFAGTVPVVVRRVSQSRIPTLCGECEMHWTAKGAPERCEIRIVESQGMTTTRDTLWEEWAHYLRMHTPGVGDCDKHDEIYGAFFNLIKRSWDDGHKES